MMRVVVEGLRWRLWRGDVQGVMMMMDDLFLLYYRLLPVVRVHPGCLSEDACMMDYNG